MHLTLKDANGDVLFAETVGKKEMTYAARFNVNNLNDGVYQLEITSGKNRVVKELNLFSKKVETERKVIIK